MLHFVMSHVVEVGVGRVPRILRPVDRKEVRRQQLFSPLKAQFGQHSQ